MNMKIWRLMMPLDAGYAQCGLRSPPVSTHSPCPQCTIGDTYMTPSPLVFEWEPGSDQIGDFAWPSGSRVAVREPVMELLIAKKFAVKAGAIEMIQDPKLKQPKNPRRAKPRVWLPYTGPQLVELVVEHAVHILPETTTVVARQCALCGRERRHLVGAEVKQHLWSKESRTLLPLVKSRVSEQGIFVSSADVGASGFFTTYEFDFILCTDEAKAALEEAKFTNLDFWEYGDVV